MPILPAMPCWRRMIGLGLVGALALGACTPRSAPGKSPAAPTVTATSARPSASSTALEHAAFELVNRHRRARGLAPLTLDPRISRQARLHSADMAAGRMPLGHEGFDDRGQTLARMIPWRRTAENVAFNQGHRDPAAEAVRGWLASRGHRENIEGPYELTGVGVVSNQAGEVYFTQIFVGR
jgi:uncharacterized protein YkwD